VNSDKRKDGVKYTKYLDLLDGVTLETRKYEDALNAIYTCIEIYEPLMYPTVE